MQPSFQIPILGWLDEEGNLSQSAKPIPEEVLIKGYQMMLTTRMVDERMIILQRQGTITFALTALGEEACAIAGAAALDLRDWIYPQYRESGVMFWRGFTIQQYVHQMFGDAKDITLGRQMPNHFGSRALNVVHVSSPIGTKIPHAAGCAYAMKVQKENSVSVCFFGEGTTSEGDFHVGVNFAAVRKAPAIFFCRNNGYAISTPTHRQFNSEGVAPKGIGYGIPAVRIDGNDFFAVYEAMSMARKHCIEGKGPYLIEAMTYRMGAHSTADDPSVYRKEVEVEGWKKKCPIRRLRKYLEQKGLWNEKKEEETVQAIAKEIDQAIEVAKETAKPPLHTLIEHVYFEIPRPLQEEYDDVKKLLAEEK